MDDTRTAATGATPITTGRSGRSKRRRRPLKRRSLEDLQPLVKRGSYRVGPHAAKHAACEGFSERDIVGTLLYGRELMCYWEDERLLVLGYIRPSPAVSIPLHVVVEFSRPRWVDVVTAFIPIDPHRIVSRARIAEAIRYDRHVPSSRLVGPKRKT